MQRKHRLDMSVDSSGSGSGSGSAVDSSEVTPLAGGDTYNAFGLKDRDDIVGDESLIQDIKRFPVTSPSEFESSLTDSSIDTNNADSDTMKTFHITGERSSMFGNVMNKQDSPRDDKIEDLGGQTTVSCTHLTLPTIYSV